MIKELPSNECQISEDCLYNISDSQFLFYTFIPFKPWGYPICGGAGIVDFKFIVRDYDGYEYESESFSLEVCGADECSEWNFIL